MALAQYTGGTRVGEVDPGHDAHARGHVEFNTSALSLKGKEGAGWTDTGFQL